MDNLINLNNTKSNTLEFEMTIEGANSSDVDCHFVIEAKGQDFRFKAKRDEDNRWTVDIPAMPYLDRTTYKCYTEVVTEGQYFKPMDGNVNVVGSAEIFTSTPKNKTVESDIKRIEEAKRLDENREEKRKNQSWRQKEKSIEQIANELMKGKGEKPLVENEEKPVENSKDAKVRAILEESGIKPKKKKEKVSFVRTKLLN